MGCHVKLWFWRQICPASLHAQLSCLMHVTFTPTPVAAKWWLFGKEGVLYLPIILLQICHLFYLKGASETQEEKRQTYPTKSRQVIQGPKIRHDTNRIGKQVKGHKQTSQSGREQMDGINSAKLLWGANEWMGREGQLWERVEKGGKGWNEEASVSWSKIKITECHELAGDVLL